MPSPTDLIVQEIGAVLKEYIKAAKDGLEAGGAYIQRTRLAATVERFAPPGSVYARHASRVSQGKGPSAQAGELAAILTALLGDYRAGYLRTVEETVHAALFADFLEMATELQTKGFKDAAAVIAGSVLEEHLRKLAMRHSVSTAAKGKPRKADTINADLVKGGAYNKLAQKQITAWLDLRNKAAHGAYDEYDHGQVAALIRDVREFTLRHPA